MLNLQHPWNTRFKPVIIGLCLSLPLTLAIFLVARVSRFTPALRMGIMLGLATVQTVVQLIFFFQLGIESKPRWNLMMFLFMCLILVVIVGGSLWIMYSLDYNVMPMP